VEDAVFPFGLHRGRAVKNKLSARGGSSVVTELSLEDRERLVGRFIVDGRRMPRHVMTPSGPYFIGSGPALPARLPCPRCGQLKAPEHPPGQHVAVQQFLGLIGRVLEVVAPSAREKLSEALELYERNAAFGTSAGLDALEGWLTHGEARKPACLARARGMGTVRHGSSPS
jgi:hypothetical protein